MDVGYSPKLEFYDKDLADALKINIARFSAFKEDSFNRVLSDLITKTGSLPTWQEFRDEAMKISGFYNQQWLEAEYHQTVASANMAGKWKEYQRTKHIYPNLKYLTVGDDKVRDQHKEWHGLVLPIDHPFWKVNWPPNDWGCRCDVIRTDEEVTAIVPKFDISGKFKNNAGITEKIFDEKLYAAGLTGDDILRITAFALSRLSKISKGKLHTTAINVFYKLPRNVQFKQLYRGNSSELIEHLLAKKGNDYEDIISVGKWFVDNGYSAEILPVLNASYLKPFRSKIFPNYRFNKNPDLRIGNVYMDVKVVGNLSNVQRNANLAAKQGAYAIISDRFIGITPKEFERQAKRVFGKNNVNSKGEHQYRLNIIYYLYKGNIYKYNREDFIN